MKTVFFDCLIAYNSFLENTSSELIQNPNKYLEKLVFFKQIDETLETIKKKNNKLLKSKRNEIYSKGNIKPFDIIIPAYTEIEKIALMHLFVETLLKKRLPLQTIFQEKYSGKKIWSEMNDLLENMFFCFENIEFDDAKKSELSLLIA